MMIIRTAHPDDAGEIAEIWNAVIRDTALTFTTQEKSVAGLETQIDKGRFFVAQDQGLIGFACYFQFRGGPGYAHTMEHSLMFSPAAQGRGGGRALMSTLERHARENGVHSLIAGVSGENPAGVAFHKAIGFTEIARLPEVGRKFDRWMDLVLLQKFL